MNTTDNKKRPILVTGAAGKIGGVGHKVVELLLQKGLPVRAMVRTEDERAGNCGAWAPRWWSEI